MNFTLNATTVTVAAFIANQGTLDAGGTIPITDTWANVSGGLDALSADSHVTSITLTDAIAPAMTITATQAMTDTRALGIISAPWPYAITVADSASNIVTLLSEPSPLLIALHQDGVTSIAATDGSLTFNVAQAQAIEASGIKVSVPAGDSVTLADTGAALSTLSVADFTALKAEGFTAVSVTNGVPVSLTATADQALNGAVALGQLYPSYQLTVADTAAHISAAFDQLNSDGHVSSITLTDAGTPALTLTAAQALNDATALLELTTPYTITISDTAANVSANLDTLASRSDVTSVAVTDGATNALTLSVQQYENDAGLLSKITGPYLLSISGIAADVSTALDALNGDTHVSSITLTDGAPLELSAQQFNDTTALSKIAGSYSVAITDSAANVASNLDALNANVHVTSITLTDADTPLGLSVQQALNDTKALCEIGWFLLGCHYRQRCERHVELRCAERRYPCVLDHADGRRHASADADGGTGAERHHGST